jgi:hypothetical protein
MHNEQQQHRDERSELRYQLDHDLNKLTEIFEKEFKRLQQIKDIPKELFDSRYLTLWTKHKNDINWVQEEFETNKKQLEERNRRNKFDNDEWDDNNDRYINQDKYYQRGPRESILSTNSYGNNTTIVTKSMDHWEKKVKEVQKIFSELLSNKVLESLSKYTSRRDMAGAWRELNKRYFSRLIPYANSFLAALQSYRMRPGQVLSNYIWCLEIVYESCVEMLGIDPSPNALRSLLVNGIKNDRRFKHICSVMLLTRPKPEYEDFKESIQSIETENEIEKTMVNTLEKSVYRMKQDKTNYYDRSYSKHNDRVSINVNMENVKCFKCNKFGHYQKDCQECDSDDCGSVNSNVSSKSSKPSNNNRKKFNGKDKIVNKTTAKDVHQKYVNKEKKLITLKL